MCEFFVNLLIYQNQGDQNIKNDNTHSTDLSFEIYTFFKGSHFFNFWQFSSKNTHSYNDIKNPIYCGFIRLIEKKCWLFKYWQINVLHFSNFRWWKSWVTTNFDKITLFLIIPYWVYLFSVNVVFECPPYLS